MSVEGNDGKPYSIVRLLGVAMAVVALAFAVLYLRSIGPYWKLTPDSTTYVLGAKSLAGGQGYREHGSPVVLFAPGASAILIPAWLADSKTYRALNAEVILFAFLALAVLFLLFRDSLGTIGSGLAVLLCIGSTEYFERSTYLLSEIFYIFFSLLAFWCYRRGRAAGTILTSLGALMVRTVGICLPLAFALDTLLADPFRKGRRRWLYATAYAMPLLFSVGWELRNRWLGWSYTELMTENEPWNRASGHIPARQLLVRLWDNLAYGRACEDLLTNGFTRNADWAVWAGIGLGVLIALGFARLSLVKGYSAAGIYCILFSIVVVLYWPEVVVRLMAPLLPFLMAYLVAGVQTAAASPGRRWLLLPAAGLAGLYLAAGYRNDVRILAADRAARVPHQLVIYPGNEDIERLAIWWKENAGRNEIYACQHPNVINVITGRDGVIYENAGRPGGIARAMRARHARFLLLDTNGGADREADRAAVSDGDFRLLREQGKARLFELVETAATP